MCAVACAYEPVHGPRLDLLLRQLSNETSEHPIIVNEYHLGVGMGQHLGTVNRKHRLAGTRWSHNKDRLIKRRLIDFELLFVARNFFVGR